MGYKKHNFKPDQILKSEHMNEIENGIVSNENAISELKNNSHIHNNQSVLNSITSSNINSWNNKSNFSGSYNDLTNKPSIPSNVSELANDSGFATETYVNNNISNLQERMDELFQNVNNGKELVASAIIDKGIDASGDETFQSLSHKISQIPVGAPGSNIIGYINEENEVYVSLTELESGTYTLKFEDYDGLLTDFDDIGEVEVE